MKKNRLSIIIITLASCGVFFLTGCATSEQARSVKKSGFLGDYSQLKKGGGERALLYYVRPGVSWAGYDKVILDSVSIWHSENSQFDDVPKEELDNLAHYLYDAVKKQLEQNWTIVDKPGPGTIRLRMALTEAEGASREIRLSEKELNALLAKNTDLATRLAIDLSDNLASAKLLVHLDEDFPLLGGNTVKLTAGAELAYATGNPVVMLRGVSVWGVPIPNVWLGNIKNVDLAGKFVVEHGFWKSFSEGVENIRIEEGQMKIKGVLPIATDFHVLSVLPKLLHRRS